MAGQFVTEVNDSNFEQDVLKSDQPVLVDFWAAWCGPCRALAPVVDEVASQYQGKIKVMKMDVDKNSATPSRYGIRGIPALLLFKDGKVADQIVGFVPKGVEARKQRESSRIGFGNGFGVLIAPRSAIKSNARTGMLDRTGQVRIYESFRRYRPGTLTRLRRQRDSRRPQETGRRRMAQTGSSRNECAKFAQKTKCQTLNPTTHNSSKCLPATVPPAPAVTALAVPARPVATKWPYDTHPVPPQAECAFAA
jgi:thioredoxin 1